MRSDAGRAPVRGGPEHARDGAVLATFPCMSEKKADPTKPTKPETASELKPAMGPDASVYEMTLAGAVAGAATGAVAGPVGIIAGGVIGTVAGALAGAALSNDDEVHSRKDKKLDEDIGVTKGDLGAASPNQPKSTRGTFSAASSGAGSSGGASPAEGPIQDIDSDD